MVSVKLSNYVFCQELCPTEQYFWEQWLYNCHSLSHKYLSCFKIKKVCVVFGFISIFSFSSVTASDVADTPNKKGSLPYVVKIVSGISISSSVFL